MNQPGSPHPDLERYLEGLLEDDDRRAFEAKLEHDPELRNLVDQDREIRASLVRSFAADDTTAERILRHIERTAGDDALSNHGGGQTNRDGSSATSSVGGLAWLRFPTVRWLAVAAVLTIGVFGAYLIWDFLANTGWQNPYETEYRSIPQVFAAVESGDESFWICDNDRQLITTFWQQLGYGAKLGPLAEGVEALGIGYTNTITPNTIELKALYEGHPILILIDRLDAETGNVQLPPDSDLHLYRREAPPLVFYEVSRLDKPHVLDSLIPVKMPEDWIPGRGRFEDNNNQPPFDYGGQRKGHQNENQNENENKGGGN